MSDTQKREFPYKVLGAKLRRLREISKESLAEVSGAVEIEVDLLAEFERGLKRPVEDILLLLISHFDIDEDEAAKLWELGHYENMPLSGQDDDQQKITVMMVPTDPRVVYTDKVQVQADANGVVLDFMQSSGSHQPYVVSRVGMSREHADKLLALLNQSLELSRTKSLPPKE